MNKHEEFMRQAAVLALKGRGWSSPNPIVGALVTQGDAVVGRGYHARFGEAHAEAVALDQAGEKARGGTLYVTLSPCTHYGKTPPCVEAIARAGIARVVVGARDPNAGAGGGVEALSAQGVEVVSGVLEAECREKNAPFFKRVRTGLPLVSAKWAMTADGKIATARGDSKWITGAKARAFAHGLRATHDAVLVGIGTVLTDAPLLTVRLIVPDEKNPPWRPHRVILDGQARTPLNAPLWTAENGGPILIVVSSGAPAGRIHALEDKGAQVVVLAAEEGRLPIPGVLHALAERGLQSVFVEGGAEVLGSFLDTGAVDRVFVFIAPKIIGGRDGITAVRGHGAERIAQCQQMHRPRVESLGDDVLIEGRLGDWDWLEQA